MKKLSDIKNTNKTFRDLKPGDYVYIVVTPYIKNGKPSMNVSKVKDVHIDENDYSEYFGASTITLGNSYKICLFKRQLDMSFIYGSSSYTFVNKEDADKFFKEKAEKRCQEITKEIENIEKRQQKEKEDEERRNKENFTSLEDELRYIDDKYDHEVGAKNVKKRDEEWDAAIAATKKKWANKED